MIKNIFKIKYSIFSHCFGVLSIEKINILAHKKAQSSFGIIELPLFCCVEKRFCHLRYTFEQRKEYRCKSSKPVIDSFFKCLEK